MNSPDYSPPDGASGEGAARGSSLRLSLRLALLYTGVFAVVGVRLPFWPVWLESRGLDAAEIGIVLSAALWVKVVSNPLIAQVSDRLGERRRPMIVLSLGALGVFALFALARGFWELLAVSLLAGVFFAPIMPLTENLTLLVSYTRGLDYGRIRLWGSLSFIAAAALCGRLLLGRSPDIVLWLMLGGLGFTALVCFALPDIHPPRAEPRAAPVRRLLAQPMFLVFLLSAGLIQASHIVYYGFATLHWRGQGIADDVIGWLWAEAVVAEVLLFAASGAVVRRVGPVGLLVLGGLAGVVRWSLTGLSAGLAALVVLQALHALTFAAAHLGAMHFLARTVPPELSATAQSLYSAGPMGVALGLTMLLSGALYAALGAAAFHVMAAMALAGAVLALLLGRIWPEGGSAIGGGRAGEA